MSIELPPPQTPEPGSPQELRQWLDAKPSRQIAYAGYRLHLLGEALLEASVIEAAIAGTATLSDAVRMIAWLHYSAGYPAAQLRYVLADRDLYVLVLPGRIESVDGTVDLRPYFRDLVGDEILTARALEPARALAAVQAQRMGRRAQLELRPGSAPGTYRLHIDSRSESRLPVQARLEVGNPGNRFVGRDFGEAEAALSGGPGELRVLYRESLGERVDGRSAYRDFSLNSGFVSPYGLLTIDGRSVDYRQSVDATAYEGDQSNLGASWSMLPYADFSTRWVLSLRIDETDDRVAGSGQVVVDQDYSSLELSLSRSSTSLDEVWSSSLDLVLSMRAGLGSGPTDDLAADRDFQVYLPSASLKASRADHARWSWAAELSGQVSGGRLPQQQQYVLGGNGGLSAWLPGVLVGENGYLLRAQSEWTLDADGLQFTPRLFAEVGGLAGGDIDGGSAAEWLADAGVELAVGVGPWLSASVVAAAPLYDGDGDAAIDDARADFYFRVALRY